MRAEN